MRWERAAVTRITARENGCRKAQKKPGQARSAPHPANLGRAHRPPHQTAHSGLPLTIAGTSGSSITRGVYCQPLPHSLTACVPLLKAQDLNFPKSRGRPVSHLLCPKADAPRWGSLSLTIQPPTPHSSMQSPRQLSIGNSHSLQGRGFMGICRRDTLQL